MPEAVSTYPVWQRGEYLISCDPADQDLDAIVGFLVTSYWAAGVPRQTVARSLDNSMGFSLLHQGHQVGFARVISDRATFAYLGDVFVLDDHRGQGLGKWLMACVVSHPELAGLRRWLLATRDAHPLYRGFGFESLRHPSHLMERHDPGIYLDRASDGDDGK